MAETAVFGVLCKIGSILMAQVGQLLGQHLGKEVGILTTIKSQIEKIERELKYMQAFLRQSQGQEGHNELMEIYVQDVRKLAFEIEDILDEFICMFHRQSGGILGPLKNCIRKSKNLCALHKIAKTLDAKQTCLQDLLTRQQRFHIEFPKESSCFIDSEEEHRRHALYAYSLDNNELTGVDEERERLLHWLTTAERNTCRISMWGQGGSGKTSLVRNVYEDKLIREHFAYRIWITVSQKYVADDIIRKVLKEALKDATPADLDSMNGEDLMQILRSTLRRGSYMIVFDDVWTEDFLVALTALGENRNGSRVVMTTRIKEVASLATEGHVLELTSLHETESWDLFRRWAFKNTVDGKCPRELEEVAKKIVDKCKGLPLAIVIVGNLLSFKKTDITEWMKFSDQLNWELQESSQNKQLSQVVRILSLSYKHLPSHLKNCFLFCSIFPEDYLISRKKLIRLWVAEGLIEPIPNRTMEDVAEEYVYELIDRCLLQVFHKNSFGRVHECQMHDIVRELAISISMKEKFCMAYRKSQRSTIDYESRRLSIHEYDDSIRSSLRVAHVRSFYQFDTTKSPSSSLSWLSQNARYLKVLELERVPITSLPKDVTSLFNLHYLGLRRTEIEQLPRSIHRLHNLQTLDITFTGIGKLPHGITKLNRLRHLLVGKLSGSYMGIQDQCNAVEVPEGPWELGELQALGYIYASMDLVRQLQNMTQLRSLSIGEVKTMHCEQLFISVGKMHSLVSLRVGSPDDELITLEALDPPPRHLQKLYLIGKLQESVLGSALFQAFQDNLKVLSLCNSMLNTDPLPTLSCLSNLASLHLRNAYKGELLLFQRGWFPKLHALFLEDLPKVKSIVIEQQSMENLEFLRLTTLTELKEVPQGIEFLASLQCLDLVNMHPEFMGEIRDIDNTRIKHIPSVKYFDQSRDSWFRLPRAS